MYLIIITDYSKNYFELYVLYSIIRILYVFIFYWFTVKILLIYIKNILQKIFLYWFGYVEFINYIKV